MRYSDIIGEAGDQGSVSPQKAVKRKTTRMKPTSPRGFIALLSKAANALPLRAEMEPFAAAGANAVLLTDLFADAPGQGAGTQFMTELVASADRYGIAIFAMPDTPRNRTFYSRFGFEDSARFPGYMGRLPDVPAFMK